MYVINWLDDHASHEVVTSDIRTIQRLYSALVANSRREPPIRFEVLHASSGAYYNCENGLHVSTREEWIKSYLKACEGYRENIR